MQNSVLRTLYFSLLLLWASRSFAGALWLQDKRFNDVVPSGTSPVPPVSLHFTGHCALLCKWTDNCKGFFYNRDTQTCLTTTSVYLSNGDGLLSLGSRYYRTAPQRAPRRQQFHVAPCSHVTKKQRLSCPADGMTQSYALHELSATCYEMNSVGTAWTTARDLCEGRQGRLAVLDTQDKLDFLLSFFRAGSVQLGKYFIGAHRPYAMWNTSYPNGRPDFVWLDGQSVDMAMLGPYLVLGEPNNYNNVENVLIFYWATLQSNWFVGDNIDRSPTLDHYYVCEYALF